MVCNLHEKATSISIEMNTTGKGELNMKKGLLILFLLCVVLTGCGVGNSANPSSGEEGHTGDDGSLDIHSDLVEKKPAVFTYELVNNTTDVIEFDFTSSQRIDYSIKTKNKKELFLFSSVTVFLTVLGEEVLNPGEALTYDIDVGALQLEPGDYILTVWLTPKDGKQYEETKEFTIK